MFSASLLYVFVISASVLFLCWQLLSDSFPGTVSTYFSVVLFAFYFAGCWRYDPEVNRTSLLLQQILNQDSVYRTRSSYWCNNTRDLKGTILSTEYATAFLTSQTDGLVVRVEWSNGIEGFHRMGIGQQWDLDTICE